LTPPATFGGAPEHTIEPLSAPAPAPTSAPVPEVVPEPGVAVVGEPIEPIRFAPLQLDSSPVLRPPRTASPAVAAAPTPVAEPVPASDPAPAPEPVVESSTETAGNRDQQPVVVSTFVPVGVVAPDAELPAAVLPRIVEATPVPETDPAEVEPVSSGPLLPQVQAAVQAPVAAHDAFVVPATHVETARPARKQSSRGPLLFLTLIVLSAVVAAAVVFGRPYLFPDDWDAETRPYAEAIEIARGVEFVEPIALISEPTTPYTERMMNELVGDWSEQESTWRALGLLTGASTSESVAAQIVGWQDAVYSGADGQVYRDAGASGADLDAQIAEAVAAASLDQQFRWSSERDERTLEGDVLTLAEVRRQSAPVVADTPYAVASSPIDPTPLAFVPPVVAYRLLAPTVYAEFANPDGTLSDLGPTGPGPLVADTPVMAPGPVVGGSDTLVSSPQAMDRSFWYLVLGGFLETRPAYDASEAIVENSLSIADRGGQRCVYATFAGGDVDQTATLRSALEAWSAAAPAELGSSFGVLADGSLQLVSCDPGASVEIANRGGVARELVAWRTAELATIEAVVANDGTAADVDAAWAIVRASDMGPSLGSLPAGTTPADTADAARDALTELFTPAAG
jgi:hypothetical protein